MSWILLLLACGSAPEVAAPSEAASVRSVPTAPTALARVDSDVDALAAAQKAGATIVDVRSPEEFASGHVPGAVNRPVGGIDIEDPLFADHSKEQPIWFVCASGKRSAIAADQLAAAGYAAISVQGGTQAWIAKGYPVE